MSRGDDGARDRRKPPPDPTRKALGLLLRREHSRRELERKLAAAGVEPGDAEATVDRLAARGWQDDRRFAETLARTRLASGHGPLRIRAELSGHGLAADCVEAAIAGLEADWPEQAHRLLARRLGTKALGDPVRRRKAAAFLYRRGFDSDSVRAAIRSRPEEVLPDDVQSDDVQSDDLDD